MQTSYSLNTFFKLEFYNSYNSDNTCCIFLKIIKITRDTIISYIHVITLYAFFFENVKKI